MLPLLRRRLSERVTGRWLHAHPQSGIEAVVFDVFTEEDARAYFEASAAARRAGAWEHDGPAALAIE